MKTQKYRFMDLVIAGDKWFETVVCDFEPNKGIHSCSGSARVYPEYDLLWLDIDNSLGMTQGLSPTGKFKNEIKSLPPWDKTRWVVLDDNSHYPLCFYDSKTGKTPSIDFSEPVPGEVASLVAAISEIKSGRPWSLNWG